MQRLRQILSVPMFLTALALAWVLGRQAGVDGMTLGLAAVLLASLGLWWTGRRQHAGRERAGLPAGGGNQRVATLTVPAGTAPGARSSLSSSARTRSRDKPSRAARARMEAASPSASGASAP